MANAKSWVALAVLFACIGCSDPDARDVFDIEESALVDCDSVDDWLGELNPHYTTVLDVVAVPGGEDSPRAMQTANADGGLWESTKSAIMVPNGGSSFTLSVPKDVRDRLFIWDWGASGFKYGIQVPGCERTEDFVEDWLILAGGLTVREPACVPLVVSDGSEEERVMVGVGAPCPGQQPPLE